MKFRSFLGTSLSSLNLSFEKGLKEVKNNKNLKLHSQKAINL